MWAWACAAAWVHDARATTGPALASRAADWHLTLLPPCAALTDPRHQALSPEGLRRLGTGTVLQDRVLSYNFSLLDGRPVSAVAASAGAAQSEGRGDSEGSVAFGLLHKIESLAQGITMEELMYGCPNRGRLSVFNTLRCHLCRVVWSDAPGHAATIAGICRLASGAPRSKRGSPSSLSEPPWRRTRTPPSSSTFRTKRGGGTR